MKKHIRFYRIMALVLLIALLVSCRPPNEKTVETISPEMTGFDDFYQGMWDGEAYVIVYGSQGSDRDTIRLKNFAEWIQTSLDKNMAVFVPVKSDQELSEEAAKDSHLILLGNPDTNLWLASMNEQLPIQVMEGELEIQSAGATIGEETAMFTYLVPSPLNQSKYLWVWGSSHADTFDRLWTMTMNHRQDEYMIKVDERTRYSGTFSKLSTAWTIPTLEANKTIGDFESVMSEHFIVRYDPIDRSSQENMEEIIKRRELCYKEFADRLGFEPESLIEIDIYMTEGIMEHYVGRDDDTLLAVIYEVHEQGEEDPSYKEKLAQVFIGTLGVPLDQMAQVGLAKELASSQIYLLSSVHPEAAMREIIETDAYLPLASLSGARINPDLDKVVVKEELRSFFHYLIEIYGMEQMLDLYAANEHVGIEIAIESVYGKDLASLESEWLTFIRPKSMEKESQKL